jgi:hypothetical protein
MKKYLIIIPAILLSSCCKCIVTMPSLIPVPYEWELVPVEEEVIFVEQDSK